MKAQYFEVVLLVAVTNSIKKEFAFIGGFLFFRKLANTDKTRKATTSANYNLSMRVNSIFIILTSTVVFEKSVKLVYDHF